jgi:ligand-binding sensor domain-containing protein
MTFQFWEKYSIALKCSLLQLTFGSILAIKTPMVETYSFILNLFRKNRTVILLLGMVSLFCLPLTSKADDFKIVKISPEGGFTFDAITSICEDKFGFIWFGSNSGVYRYNSVETAKFINSPEDINSLPGNSVRSLYRDMKDELWVSTYSGVCRFDNQNECFRRYIFHDASGNLRGASVLQILQTADSTYWLVDSNGFAKIDFRTNLATSLPLPDSNNNDLIRLAVVDKADGRIWLGGQSGGIYYCDKPYDKIVFFARESPENVFTILPDGNKVWVGYDWGGADLFTKQGSLSKHYGDDAPEPCRIPSSRVRTIFRDKNEIWFGTFKGLTRMKPEGMEVIQKEKYPGLQNNSIFQIFRDSKNGIWIGTWSGGLSYINEWANSFEHYKRESFSNSLSDNVVSDFDESPDGKVIVATEEGNLNFMDPANQNFVSFQIHGSKGVVNHIKSLYTDRFGTLWIGTFASGVFYKTQGSKDYKHFDLIDENKEQFYDINSTREGVWFGSSLRGLFFYDYETRQVRKYVQKSSDPESLSANSVRTLLTDSKGNLWVGTGNGLNRKNAGSEKFVRYFYNQNEKNRISSNNIYSLFEDSKQNIWIGTAGGGVNIYNPFNGEFSQLSKKDGLPGNDVYGILEDNSGVIWMSTENGIGAYSPSGKSFRNFDFTDGLQGNQFNPGSLLLRPEAESFILVVRMGLPGSIQN